MAAALVIATVLNAQSSTTPEAVYRILNQAADKVRQLRREAQTKEPWPKVRTRGERAPRHVLQKSYEVLNKINRLRQVKNLGLFSIPDYPARPVAPDEVLRAGQRILGELNLLLNKTPSIQALPAIDPQEFRTISNEECYTVLLQISRALDPVLGVRGLTPGDVYAQSLRVLENSRFLRQSQNLAMNISPPKKTRGRHPNHALRAGTELLRTISQAEQRLWMVPCQVQPIPKRKIEPNEVYDLLQIILAEQQRLKFRLGIDRQIAQPAVDPTQTPDDVIYNLTWARLLLPKFNMDQPIIQYDPASLKRQPSDVLLLSRSIYSRLIQHREIRGIRVQPREQRRFANRNPKHVYIKVLNCLEKTNRLREQSGLRRTFVPAFPLRKITPAEVYDIALRLDNELKLITSGKNSSAPPKLMANESTISITPTDVFESISKSSLLLDTLLGPLGYSQSDVHQQATLVVDELGIIRAHLGLKRHIRSPQLILGKESRDVFPLIQNLLNQTAVAQVRAGLKSSAFALEEQPENITPSDIYNDLGIVLAELYTLKIRMGIQRSASIKDKKTDRTPSHVFQQLQLAQRAMESILKDDPTADQVENNKP